ncbi:MAG TPA: proline dehydrogenase family protein [Chitinophagaceae bacterium]|nr:proline dehydrogenase family protein [Chitinophagaceae bacterium]
MNISFDNTEHAFAYKADKDLKQAYRLFAIMRYNWLVWIGTRIMPWAMRIGLPIKKIIRNTLFKQFVGGETLEQTNPIDNLLQHYNVQVILDYGIEGKETEDAFETATNNFIQVIEYAALQKNIPFISIKLTAIARFGLLEKLNNNNPTTFNTDTLTTIEQLEWERVQKRIQHICTIAATKKIGVLIDAEETWIQNPIDYLSLKMMQIFNQQQAIVYNTIQLYRTDRLQFLHENYNYAIAKNFLLGVKLVRGAYMEKERKRALQLNYPSPIQPNKASSDKDYNDAIHFCIDRLKVIATIIASHNEESNLLTTQLLQQKKISLHHPHIHFSQLYGMSDHITFNLAKAGCSVSKYVPFGPIKDVVPYLMRRAQENSSVKGQTGRELSLLRKEIKRRKI